mgnify:CR=1 FL=1
MERIFQRYASRRSLFYDLNYASPSRHLIRRLTLGNAAGIFKDNLVPFGANAEGICPKRSNTSCPPSPQGEGICSRYFVRKRILSATALRCLGTVLLSQCLLQGVSEASRCREILPDYNRLARPQRNLTPTYQPKTPKTPKISKSLDISLLPPYNDN